MLGTAPATRRSRLTYAGSIAAAGGFVLVGVLAAGAAPVLDHSLNPGATRPGLISFLGVGLPVLALTALLLSFGLRRLLPQGGVFLAAAVGYNAILIAVKFALGPITIYAQNDYYRAHALPVGGIGEDPGFHFLTGPLAYPGLAAMMALLYGGAFAVLYLIFRARLLQRLGLPARTDVRFIQLFIAMFIVAAVGGITIIGLLGILEYASTIVYAGTAAILIALALVAAIALCSIAFREAAEQAATLRNVTMLSTFAWIGLAFIAAYHILWVVFLLTLISLWPLKPWAYVSGAK